MPQFPYQSASLAHFGPFRYFLVATATRALSMKRSHSSDLMYYNYVHPKFMNLPFPSSIIVNQNKKLYHFKGCSIQRNMSSSSYIKSLR